MKGVTNLGFITLLAVALGLAMDSLSLSVLNGFLVKKIYFRYAIKVGLFFGVFQGIMPLIGWGAGNTVKIHIQRYDHWVDFIILVFIGLRLIFSTKIHDKSKVVNWSLNTSTLIVLAFVTSIDALAVGVSFAILDIEIIFAAMFIGSVTLILCFLGVYTGSRYGKIFGDKLEIIGGVILILIGLKILIEHIVKNI